MRKLVALLMVLVLAAAGTTAALAGGNSPVQYTFTLADLGQGGHGGGPLYADGSADGHVTISGGQVIVHFHPTSWSWVVPGESVDICFDVHQIKGPPSFPPTFCLSEAGFALPVSGTPVIITNPFSGVELLVRVTPAN